MIRGDHCPQSVHYFNDVSENDQIKNIITKLNKKKYYDQIKH